MFAQNVLKQTGMNQTVHQDHISNELLGRDFCQDIFAEDRNVTFDVNQEKYDTLVASENTYPGANVHDNSSNTRENDTEKQLNDFNKSPGYICDQVWLNEMEDVCKSPSTATILTKLGENLGMNKQVR